MYLLMMDSREKHALWKEREAISEDLTPKYILPSLVADGIFSEDERNVILSEVKRETQTAKLLSLLLKKGKKAFSSFVKALESDGAYPWLAKKLLASVDSDKVSKDFDQNLYDVLRKGGVPFQINHLLPRKSLEKEIRQALQVVSKEKRGWVVIHGMMGSGKSVLAAEALRYEILLSECFSNGVWWIPVGNIDSAGLLVKMQMLYENLDEECHPVPESIEKVTTKLKNLLLKSCYEKILFILDDVWNSSVLQAFDVGCPVLVTTRNNNILSSINSGQKIFIKVDEGLSVDESKHLLAMWVNADVNSLPSSVDRICEKCKGCPLVLVMVGSMMAKYGNKERRWEHYRQCLEARNFDRIQDNSGESKKTLYDIIELCLSNTMSPEERTYYSDFALFIDDVMIPNKVLEILWDKDEFEVEDIMYKICNKSLARMDEDKEGDSYVYSIHDLHLDYLKNACKDLKALHTKLINKYLKKCEANGMNIRNYGLLPSDGYIHQYIGYHIYKAEMFHLFPDIFLNLRFVQKKLHICGPSVLLNDYVLYGMYFNTSEAVKEKQDLEKFIQCNAHHLCDSTKDFIQLALCQPQESTVYKKARVFAEKSGKNMYFNWCNVSSIRNSAKLCTKLHLGAVHCARFSPDGTFVVSVGEDKIVRVWDIRLGLQLHWFQGHEGPIKCCSLSSTGFEIVTASEDSTVRLFRLNPSVLRTDSIREEEPLRKRSSSRKNIFQEDDSFLVFREHEGEVRWCSFSPSDELVVSGGVDGIAMVWSAITGKVCVSLTGHIFPINCCCFSPDEKRIATASSELVVLWNILSGTKLLSFPHMDHSVLSCRFSNDGKHLISAAGPFIWKWDLISQKLKCQYNNLRTSYYAICCVSSPDEQYLAAGTSDCAVVIWSANSDQVAASFKGHDDPVQTVDYSCDGSMLLSGSEDGTVMVWDTSQKFNTSMISLSTEISVRFQDNHPVIAASDESNSIQVIKGLKGEMEYKTTSEEEDISCCNISLDCKYVVYGTKKGSVKVLRRPTKSISNFHRHRKAVRYCVFTEKGNHFITCSEDCTLRVWQLKGTYVSCFGHHGPVLMCKVFRNDSMILSCSEDGWIRVWQLDTGRCLIRCDGHNKQTVTSCDVSRDGTYFASTSVDKTVKVWKEDNGKLIIVNTITSNSCIRSCCFSPNEKFLAFGDDDGVVQIANLDAEGKQLKILGSHTSNWVNDLAFSPDSNFLVSVANSIKWWDIRKNQPLLQTFEVRGSFLRYVYPSPDFTIFVSVDSAGVLYNLQLIKSSG
ncbi:apoptotic protease-activating factor 1-like isoform X2 [Limulus polyphemus]|uniref:Apoptotic protease-activating factor 1-like isoform X2 n=1 Tax=Limulus polyphemus TaxID=6850 RepID=A0ABM1B8J6_LIMPO|nr:apoptotic protease-activating factor 1-like isoform X2 [Limulus polyphemus]